MTSIYAGIGDCPDCDVRVLFAMDAHGELVPLDEGRDGPVAVRWDITDTPRVRPVNPDYKPREGEHRFRLHRDSCSALARVRQIGSARSIRRVASVRPRRLANAR
jgi:hypothetical protein